MGEDVSALIKKKNLLLNEYMKASAKDKAEILVRIIDIDDKLEDILRKKKEKEKK